MERRVMAIVRKYIENADFLTALVILLFIFGTPLAFGYYFIYLTGEGASSYLKILGSFVGSCLGVCVVKYLTGDSY